MSKNLAQVITEVETRIQSANLTTLFLDFDGTLVPIADNPAEPQLESDDIESLRRVSNQDFLVTTIISGRAVEDLYARIRLKGIIYAGNHGLEIFGRNLRFVEPLAWSQRERLESLCEELRAALRSISGTLVEHKGLTASVHYRLVSPTDVPAVDSAVRAIVARNGGPFRINSGRKVLEIVPRTDWHKGAAVRWINGNLNPKPDSSIYLGDDSTDEDAFSVLPDEITVKVGGQQTETSARYRLPDPAAVQEFLEWLAAWRPAKRERA